jgi:photosystem II biogenesis protein Psp29
MSYSPVSRTVSDTKRDFFAAYPRPINSVYRRVVDELLVEVHLLVTNEEFRYDPLFANGLLTAFQAFMENYRPAEQREVILQAFCSALKLDLGKIQQDANEWRKLAELPSQEVLEVMVGTREPSPGPLSTVRDTWSGIVGNVTYKYSRISAIGLANIVEQVARSAQMSEKDRLEKLQQICTFLKVDYARVKRDLDLFVATLDRVRRSKEVVDEIAAADRKKQDERAASAST